MTAYVDYVMLNADRVSDTQQPTSSTMTTLCYVILYAGINVFPAHAEHRFSFTSTRHCPGATDDGAESFIIDSGHGRSDRGMKLLCEFLMIGCGRTMKRSKRGFGGGSG